MVFYFSCLLLSHLCVVSVIHAGCHNDVGNVKDYLENALGFRDEDMLVLMDDQKHHPPTRQNIINAYKRVAEYSKPGDVVFIHYSGHGGRLVDQDGT